MFIKALTDERYVNLRHATEIYLKDGYWYADMIDGVPVKIGSGDIEKRILTITNPVMPAPPDQMLFRFWIDAETHMLREDQLQILAWAIDASFPTPITSNGSEVLGWDDETLTVIQHPDGTFDDQCERTYKGRGAIEQEIKNQMRNTA